MPPVPALLGAVRPVVAFRGVHGHLALDLVLDLSVDMMLGDGDGDDWWRLPLPCHARALHACHSPPLQRVSGKQPEITKMD